jgi:hypothetical protein
MILTKAHRADFLDAVMAGIPIRHPFDIDKAKREIRIAIENQLPRDVRYFIERYPDLVKREKYIGLSPLKSGQYAASIHVIDRPEATKIDLAPWIKAQDLAEAEEVERFELRARLAEIAASCSTLAKLKAALPELESYMPKEAIPSKNLPVAAGSVVTDLLAVGLKVPK